MRVNMALQWIGIFAEVEAKWTRSWKFGNHVNVVVGRVYLNPCSTD